MTIDSSQYNINAKYFYQNKIEFLYQRNVEILLSLKYYALFKNF